VEAGAREIEFRFRPASLRFGAWLSILGLSFIAAAALFYVCSGIRKNSDNQGQPI
jgi:hypothetical protein